MASPIATKRDPVQTTSLNCTLFTDFCEGISRQADGGEIGFDAAGLGVGSKVGVSDGDGVGVDVDVRDGVAIGVDVGTAAAVDGETFSSPHPASKIAATSVISRRRLACTGPIVCLQRPLVLGRGPRSSGRRVRPRCVTGTEDGRLAWTVSWLEAQGVGRTDERAAWRSMAHGAITQGPRLEVTVGALRVSCVKTQPSGPDWRVITRFHDVRDRTDYNSCKDAGPGGSRRPSPRPPLVPRPPRRAGLTRLPRVRYRHGSVPKQSPGTHDRRNRGHPMLRFCRRWP